MPRNGASWGNRAFPRAMTHPRLGTLDPDDRGSTTMTQIRSHPVERGTESCCALYKRVRRSFTGYQGQVGVEVNFVVPALALGRDEEAAVSVFRNAAQGDIHELSLFLWLNCGYS